MNNFEQLTINDSKVLFRPAADANECKGTLVLLHGYGADEYDLMGLAPYFDANLQVFSIRGPGATMYGGASWFDIDMFADGSLKFNTEQALESHQRVISILQALQVDDRFQIDKYILAGFSQGASISNMVTLAQPDLIKALLIMSGRLTEDVAKLLANKGDLKGLPVFAGHGTNDQVIPIEFGRKIVEFWSDLPVELDHHEYTMAHEICQDELQDIQSWLKKYHL